MSAWLTPQQVAERWQCSAEHVQRLCASGCLPAMRLGGRGWRIRPEAVEAYEAEHTTASTSAEPGYAVRHTPDRSRRAVAAAIPGDAYAPVFAGPVPWRSEVIDAAPRAARRGGSATTRKRA